MNGDDWLSGNPFLANLLFSGPMTAPGMMMMLPSMHGAVWIVGISNFLLLRAERHALDLTPNPYEEGSRIAIMGTISIQRENTIR